MSLELDDRQQVRHTSTTVAEHARIMFDALLDQGFDRAYAEQLHMFWWKHIWTQASAPDLEGLLKGFRET